jgi:hypothetical protein
VTRSAAVPTRAREWSGPNVVAARNRGVIRVDHAVLTAPVLSQLSGDEFRAVVLLWAYVARFGKDGEFPREWVRNVVWWSGSRRRRITLRMLKRLVELGLLEEYVYDDDATEVLQIANWRNYRPVDLTSQERKRRFRRRLYGDAYYGTDGDVMEITSPASVTALEEERRFFQHLSATTPAGDRS